MSKKADFIFELSHYLAGPNQVRMSVALHMGSVHAEQWVKLRSCTPLTGYPTAAEAEKILTRFLGEETE